VGGVLMSVVVAVVVEIEFDDSSRVDEIEIYGLNDALRPVFELVHRKMKVWGE
jgi:hypothetical protein